MMTVQQDGPTFAELVAMLEGGAADALLSIAGRFDTALRNTEPIRSGFMYDSTYLEQVDALHFIEHIDAPYASLVDEGTRYITPRFFVEQTIAEIEPQAPEVILTRLEQVPGWQR